MSQLNHPPLLFFCCSSFLPLEIRILLFSSLHLSKNSYAPSSPTLVFFSFQEWLTACSLSLFHIFFSALSRPRISPSSLFCSLNTAFLSASRHSAAPQTASATCLPLVPLRKSLLSLTNLLPFSNSLSIYNTCSSKTPPSGKKCENKESKNGGLHYDMSVSFLY